MAENVTRVTVTLPTRQVERLKELVAEGRHPSVSAYVADLVAEDLADVEAQDLFWAAVAAEAGDLTPADRDWLAEAQAVIAQARAYYAELGKGSGAA